MVLPQIPCFPGSCDAATLLVLWGRGPGERGPEQVSGVLLSGGCTLWFSPLGPWSTDLEQMSEERVARKDAHLGVSS